MYNSGNQYISRILKCLELVIHMHVCERYMFLAFCQTICMLCTGSGVFYEIELSAGSNLCDTNGLRHELYMYCAFCIQHSYCAMEGAME
jgi:hypothetical protein